MAQAMTGGVSYRTGHTPSVSAYAEPPPSSEGGFGLHHIKNIFSRRKLWL